MIGSTFDGNGLVDSQVAELGLGSVEPVYFQVLDLCTGSQSKMELWSAGRKIAAAGDGGLRLNLARAEQSGAGTGQWPLEREPVIA